MRVLIAEDEAISRRLLQRHLENLGLEVIPAGDGKEAWEIFQEQKEGIQMVIIDWMMPGMDGIELCRRIRETENPHYVYLIFLSAKGQKEDIIAGLEAGADDYITKPFDPAELQVRVAGGRRIIELEKRLKEQNEQLKVANEVMRKDLEAAARAQMSLLPSDLPRIEGVEFAARFIPSSFVSGDIYNVFRLDEKHIGLYQLDVSGHGVAAAFLSISLYQRLSHDLNPHGLLKIPLKEPPYYSINPPRKVISLLEREYNTMLEQQGHYFTMIYAIFNVQTGDFRFCRAGHTFPLLIHNDGTCLQLEGGGPPVGLGLSEELHEEQHLKLSPGDQLIVYSDGLSEARGEEGIFGDERIKDFFCRHYRAPLDEALGLLLEEIKGFQGREEFADDASILALRWSGPMRN